VVEGSSAAGGEVGAGVFGGGEGRVDWGEEGAEEVGEEVGGAWVELEAVGVAAGVVEP
jgi:hypothetical protein